MATRAASFLKTNEGVAVVTWEGITENDDGALVSMAAYPNKTVQAIGDFTSSGAITMQGSNDGENWATLTNPRGEDIVLTAATQIEVIVENPLFIRPVATAGSDVQMDVIVVGAPRG